MSYKGGSGELEWYLRDHFFRQSNAGKIVFSRESLPNEMICLYLRYRHADLQQLSHEMAPVIEDLISKNIVNRNGNELKLAGKLTRLQCSKCFYINYLANVEPRTCTRCQHTGLNDFPKKA